MHPRCGLIVLGLVACSPVTPPPPSCTASTCAGCCDAQGQCQDGTSTTACGRLGLVCASCQTGQSCVAGLCQGTALGGGTSGGATAGGSGGPGGGAAGGVGGGTAGGATGGGAVDGGMGGGAVGTRPRQFSTAAARFAVPSAIYNAERSLGTGRGTNWNTLDLTGDGRLDLVVTSDANGVVLMSGTSVVWHVFAGGPTGFSTTATLFAVPGSSTNAPISQTDSAVSPRFWNTLDLTGDGFPDFVQTMNPAGPLELPFFVGVLTDGWLLRPGSRAGFATAMTNFSVPVLTNRVDRAFADLARKRWGLANLTADRTPDLVITADQQTDSVWSNPSGGPEWVICVGSASGYGELSRCSRVAVPASGSPGGFRAVASTLPGQGLVWLLTDMDGDGRDDLVQTMNPATIGSTFGVGGTTAFWKVWLNQATAGTPTFSPTPLSWAVPATSYSTPDSIAAPQLWSLNDLDGDGVKDLVLTTDVNSGRPFMSNNTPSWHVHLGNRRAFASAASVWPVPVGPGVDGFRAIRGPTWGLLDLTFDGVPDLVEFADPNRNQAFSDGQGTFWKVYAAIP